MQVDKIEVEYCTNYNGVNVTVNGEYTADDVVGDLQEKLRELEGNIVDDLVDETDDNGYYYGSTVFATNVISKHVAELFGDECELDITFDNVSS